MNSTSTDPSQGARHPDGHAWSSPGNAAALIILVPLVTVGLSYLVSWMTSPLNKFPGPPVACESCVLGTEHWREPWQESHSS